MALIERLMNLNAAGNDTPPPGDPAQARIPVHLFFSAAHEVALGPRTAAQIKSYWSMDAATATEFDTLAAQVTGSDTAKMRKLEDFHAVFMLAEARVTFYTTPAEVRTRLGI